jgi:hypothetical protein
MLLMKRPAHLSVAPQKFKLNILRICVYFNFEKRNTIVTIVTFVGHGKQKLIR